METGDPPRGYYSGPGGLGQGRGDAKWSDSVCSLNFIISEEIVIYERGQGIKKVREDFGLNSAGGRKGWERGPPASERLWSWSLLDWKLLRRKCALHSS